MIKEYDIVSEVSAKERYLFKSCHCSCLSINYLLYLRFRAKLIVLRIVQMLRSEEYPTLPLIKMLNFDSISGLKHPKIPTKGKGIPNNDLNL